MATLNSVEITAGAGPKAVHAGENVAKFSYSTSAALSAGDVIQLVRIPTGATVTDICIMMFGPAAGGNHAFGVGDGSSTARYGSISVVSTTVMFRLGGPAASALTGGLGFRVSVSDDAAVRYDTLDLYCNAIASAAAGYVFVGVVRYTMDP